MFITTERNRRNQDFISKNQENWGVLTSKVKTNTNILLSNEILKTVSDIWKYLTDPEYKKCRESLRYAKFDTDALSTMFPERTAASPPETNLEYWEAILEIAERHVKNATQYLKDADNNCKNPKFKAPIRALEHRIKHLKGEVTASRGQLEKEKAKQPNHAEAITGAVNALIIAVTAVAQFIGESLKSVPALNPSNSKL
jgi:hypothetical protein